MENIYIASTNMISPSSMIFMDKSELEIDLTKDQTLMRGITYLTPK